MSFHLVLTKLKSVQPFFQKINLKFFSFLLVVMVLTRLQTLYIQILYYKMWAFSEALEFNFDSL